MASVENVELVYLQQRLLSTSFNKTCDAVEAAVDWKLVTLEELNALKMQLDDKFQRLSAIHDDMLEMELDKGDDDGSESTFETLEAWREKYHYTSDFLNDLISSVSTGSEAPHLSQARKLNLINRLRWRQFDGDPKNYLEFWGKFRQIHNDETITTEDKFKHLLQSVTPRSEAERLVVSFYPAKENYEKALSELKTRFGRDDLLVQTHVRELLSLVAKSAAEKEKMDLGELYDMLKSHLLALESLGRTKEMFADFLEPLVEFCLPVSVLRAWERSRKTSESSDDTAMTSARSLEDLMKFLCSEVESEEIIALVRVGIDAKVPPSPYRKGRFPECCVFCQSTSHPYEVCPAAQNMTGEQLREALFRSYAAFKNK